tara:strand:- start:9853 stop:10317 length:465 start_codon:yes stop_codon:yes gene_type:complete
MYLSRNFSLNELTKSQTALRNGLDNTPSTEEIVALTVLCNNILQPVRDKYGSFSPNSGFRTVKLCELVGSSAKSQHAKGEAADIEVAGVDNYQLAEWISKNLDFDQLILEFYNSDDPSSGWVHVSYNRLKEEQRHDIRHTVVKDKKVSYKQGMP